MPQEAGTRRNATFGVDGGPRDPGGCVSHGHIPRNRRISPNRRARSLRVGGGRQECTDGTREDVAESTASWAGE
jgi:hypothetical protein